MSRPRTRLRGRIPASRSGPVTITRPDGSKVVKSALSPRQIVVLADEDERRDGGEMSRGQPGPE